MVEAHSTRREGCARVKGGGLVFEYCWSERKRGRNRPGRKAQ